MWIHLGTLLVLLCIIGCCIGRKRFVYALKSKNDISNKSAPKEDSLP